MPGPDEALFTQSSCVGVHSEGQFFVGQDVWHVAKISYLWFLHPAISGTHLHGLSQSLARPKYPLTVKNAPSGCGTALPIRNMP